MPPTKQYPDGYWKLEKPTRRGKWQEIDPSTMKPGSHPETHTHSLPGVSNKMYGLPKGFNTTKFIGRTLDEVSFTLNTICFSFDENIGITVESSLEHCDRDGQVYRVAPPVSDSRLMRLVGGLVESADAATDGTLILRFNDGQTLTCFDESADYECYHIWFGNNQVVV
jgi:hypothetical protein